MRGLQRPCPPTQRVSGCGVLQYATQSAVESVVLTRWDGGAAVEAASWTWNALCTSGFVHRVAPTGRAADTIAKRVHSGNQLRLRCIGAARRPSSLRPVGLDGGSTASCPTLSGRLRLHHTPPLPPPYSAAHQTTFGHTCSLWQQSSSVVKPAVYKIPTKGRGLCSRPAPRHTSCHSIRGPRRGGCLHHPSPRPCRGQAPRRRRPRARRRAWHPTPPLRWRPRLSGSCPALARRRRHHGRPLRRRRHSRRERRRLVGGLHVRCRRSALTEQLPATAETASVARTRWRAMRSGVTQSTATHEPGPWSLSKTAGNVGAHGRRAAHKRVRCPVRGGRVGRRSGADAASRVARWAYEAQQAVASMASYSWSAVSTNACVVVQLEAWRHRAAPCQSVPKRARSALQPGSVT